MATAVMPSSAVNANNSNAHNHTMKELPDEAIDAIVRRDIREGQSFTLHVTGNSMTPDLSKDPSQLINEADNALYNAKQGGRNQEKWQLGPVNRPEGVI